MVLLVLAQCLMVTVKLSAWTAVSTDLTGLEGWRASRHFHVTVGKRRESSPGTAHNMASSTIVSSQREAKTQVTESLMI